MQVIELAGAFGVENLREAGRPSPEPGPNEVRVKTTAASLNYRDLMLVRGHYNPKLQLPRVLLSDGAGVVEAVGPGVETVAVGQRVASCFFQRWEGGAVDEVAARSALGDKIDGVWGEEVLLRETGVVPIPDGVSDQTAATLPCAALTAWNALFEGGAPVRPGQTVLVLGTGGVSMFALQFAVAAGARVIVTSSSDEKLEKAKALGATEGINYRTEEAWDEAVLERTGGKGVDKVVEVGGSGTLPRSLKAVKLGGEIALIGVLSGVGEFNPLPAVMKAVNVRGVFVGSRAMFLDMLGFVQMHGLEPVIDRTFTWTQGKDALEYMASGAHMGKIVLEF